MTADYEHVGGAVAVAFIAFMQIRNDRKLAAEAKVNAATAKTVEKVHLLSNSAMGAQLTLNVNFAKALAVQAHRIAVTTSAEGDVAAALAADVVVETQQKLLAEHLVQQAKIDSDSRP